MSQDQELHAGGTGRLALIAFAFLVALIGFTAVALVRYKEPTYEATILHTPQLVETLGGSLPPGDDQGARYAVRYFEAANGNGFYSGWAGSTSNAGVLKIYWQGSLPAQLHEVAQRVALSLPVQIYSTQFSDVDKRAAQSQIAPLVGKQLLSLISAYGDDFVSACASPNADLSEVPSQARNGVPIVVKTDCSPSA